jgi:hypothetical protein
MGRNGWARARKDHQCGTCGEPIAKGTHYWENTASKWKRRCQRCAGIPPPVISPSERPRPLREETGMGSE